MLWADVDGVVGSLPSGDGSSFFVDIVTWLFTPVGRKVGRCGSFSN